MVCHQEVRIWDSLFSCPLNSIRFMEESSNWLSLVSSRTGEHRHLCVILKRWQRCSYNRATQREEENDKDSLGCDNLLILLPIQLLLPVKSLTRLTTDCVLAVFWTCFWSSIAAYILFLTALLSNSASQLEERRWRVFDSPNKPPHFSFICRFADTHKAF